jgi:hypothetical protein
MVSGTIVSPEFTKHRRLGIVGASPLGGVECRRRQMHLLAIRQIHDASWDQQADPWMAGRCDGRGWRVPVAGDGDVTRLLRRGSNPPAPSAKRTAVLMSHVFPLIRPRVFFVLRGSIGLLISLRQSTALVVWVQTPFERPIHPEAELFQEGSIRRVHCESNSRSFAAPPPPVGG